MSLHNSMGPHITRSPCFQQRKNKTQPHFCTKVEKKKTSTKQNTVHLCQLHCMYSFAKQVHQCQWRIPTCHNHILLPTFSVADITNSTAFNLIKLKSHFSCFGDTNANQALREQLVFLSPLAKSHSIQISSVLCTHENLHTSYQTAGSPCWSTATH